MATPAPQWGPGAADDRNCEDVDDKFTPAGRDQATDMSTLGSFTLYKITPPPENKDAFENWLSMIMRVLVSNKLDNLWMTSWNAQCGATRTLIRGYNCPVRFNHGYVRA
jgi:hypothetical protein